MQQMGMGNFDIIIVGAGAAGLMLAKAMAADAFFSEKTILLLDKDTKDTNDRTWCFWEKGPGEFDEIVHKQWNKIAYKGASFSREFDLLPYAYKMVRAIDFYQWNMSFLQQYPNITLKNEMVVDMMEQEDEVILTTNVATYKAKQVFNSIVDFKAMKEQATYPVLQQHFIGWEVQTNHPVFKKEVATYMDFSVPQQGNTRFMYVLPFTNQRALIEYTLFSEELLPTEEYTKAIIDYLTNIFNCSHFEVIATEQGSIPMTCYHFDQKNTAHIYHIGTAGGWAKPSTGYTFMSTFRKIPVLLDHIKKGTQLAQVRFKNKFWYYDLLFLDVLHQNNHLGYKVFDGLFKNRTPQQIFKFLDEETHLIEDIAIISACPTTPFINALFRRLF